MCGVKVKPLPAIAAQISNVGQKRWPLYYSLFYCAQSSRACAFLALSISELEFPPSFLDVRDILELVV